MAVQGTAIESSGTTHIIQFAVHVATEGAVVAEPCRAALASAISRATFRIPQNFR
jgi:hypothetical protein